MSGPEPEVATEAAPDPFGDAIRRHPITLRRHLDVYLEAVARELQTRGVLTGAPQRTVPSDRLIGSIVVDCTAVRATSCAERQSLADQHTPGAWSLDDPVRREGPAPVSVTWDELTGWRAGLRHDKNRSSCRYLHPDLLPPATAVAEFVVGLAMGRSVGAPRPPGPMDIVRSRLRLLQ